MLEIFRDGFYKNVLIVIIASILIGTFGTIALSQAMDRYFGQFVSGLIGDVGEYDIIVHVNAEMAETAADELRKNVVMQYPGSEVKKGVTVAGNANFLVRLPEEFKTKEGLEKFPGVLRNLPGSNGYTLMIEPRLTIRTTVPEVREYLLEKISLMKGVRFACVNRGNIEVMLSSEKELSRVRQEINRVLAGMKLVQIRLTDIESLNEVAEELTEKMGKYFLKDVSNQETTSNDEVLQKGLRQMRNILELYPSDNSVADRINDLAEILGELQNPLPADTLHEFLSSLNHNEELFSDEIDVLKNVLSNIGEELESTGEVVGLESSPWFGEHLDEVLKGLETLSHSAENVRQELLEQIKQALESSGGVDESLESLGEVAENINQLAETLPRMSEKERESLIKTIDNMLTEADDSDKLYILVSGNMSDNEIEDMIYSVAGNEGIVTISAPGMVESSIWGIADRIIGETKSTVSALVAFVITTLFLILDHSSLMSTARALARLKGKGESIGSSVIYGMMTGLVLFVCIYHMSEASIPYLHPWHICILGAVLGLLAALMAEKFCHVNEDEIAAGLSMGLSMNEIMEMIVIPSGRPGLMQYFTRRKQTMPKFVGEF